MILELYIDAENVSVIEPNSFSSEYLKDLTVLSLKNMNVSTITANILKGLNNLHTFIVDGLPIISFDSHVLLDVNQTLEKLEINSNPNNEINLFNITGNTVLLTKLETLSIRNCFIETIFTNSLQGLSVIKFLEFTNNQLKLIEVGAFQSIRNSIQFIDLRNNLLTTIDSVFDVLIHINNLIIHIGNNAWNCYPMDEKLINLLETYPKIFVDRICEVDDLSINCVDDQNNNQLINVSINEMPFNVAFMENENILHIQFDQQQQTSNYFLLWYHTIIDNIINCAQSRVGSYLLENLMENTAYTLCSMNKFKTTVSPLDCMSYYHKAKPKDYIPWILQKYKIQYIIIYLVACFVLIIFGFGIVYLLFLMYPVRLLQGGTGVIIVKNRIDFIGQDEGPKYV